MRENVLFLECLLPISVFSFTKPKQIEHYGGEETRVGKGLPFPNSKSCQRWAGQISDSFSDKNFLDSLKFTCKPQDGSKAVLYSLLVHAQHPSGGRMQMRKVWKSDHIQTNPRRSLFHHGPLGAQLTQLILLDCIIKSFHLTGITSGPQTKCWGLFQNYLHSQQEKFVHHTSIQL